MKYCSIFLFAWLIGLVGLPFPTRGQSKRQVSVPMSQPIEEPQKSLAFIQNKNQWDPSVRYMAPIPGGKLYLQANSLLYSFYEDPARAHPHGARASSGPLSTRARAHAYAVSFLGAGEPAGVKGSGLTAGYRY